MKKGWLLAVLAILFIIILIFLAFNLNRGGGERRENEVVRVIDGDTFELGSGEKVRMICIDAPEINSLGGEEAKAYLEGLILGSEVRLEQDISDRDEYGRLLRYVYVNSSEGSELFVNQKMVQAGKASVWRYGNDTLRCGEIGENLQ